VTSPPGKVYRFQKPGWKLRRAGKEVQVTSFSKTGI
jgi:hypothetical protein